MLWGLQGTAPGAPNTTARLALAVEMARPGETVMAGVELTMAEGWHTYWKNSGASGMPTEIDWDLPPGITPGPIQWPLGKKYPEGDLTTYVYSGKTMLLVPLALAPDLPLGTYPIKAKVSWLECEVLCIPGDAQVETTLIVGETSRQGPDAGQLADWMKQVPAESGTANAQAAWEGPERDGIRPVIFTWKRQLEGNLLEADFYPYSSERFEVQPDVEKLSEQDGRIRIRKAVKKFSGDWPTNLEGVVVERTETERKGTEVNLTLGSQASQVATSIWLMLVYAFIGGLILNIMPCVLPVISLKILGFVSHAQHEPRRVKVMGLVYAMGVLVSFLVLASLVIGLKSAGKAAGWGMQFGNPIFLVALTSLITLVALNLFGLFEITPGARVMDTAGNLASRQGMAGAFFNGVLATILATPCTAPFLGAALGFAFLQPAHVTVMIFVVVALGLAFPYVLLSWNPALLKFLPRPGPWMERFKVAMGFPMLATAVWLFSLLPTHYGPRSWWMLMFLTVVAIAAWIYGEFIQRGRKGKLAAGVLVVLLLGFAYFQILDGQLRWREPLAESASLNVAAKSGGIEWQPWSSEAVNQARKEGRPVLVDFTADWCLTCQANKKIAIEIPEVRAKLKEIDAVALLGDYTRLPADITAELNRFGRAGVPLVLVYPSDSSLPPVVLPEALTPGIVLDALARATK
jgi:thiol:disulfide interchange protein